MSIKNNYTLLLGLFFGFSSCNNNVFQPTFIPSGKDPNFQIVVNLDEGFSRFNRKVVVFGIDLYAVPAVADLKLLHAANVLAQYLDNNEDGTVDNPIVLDHMLANKAFLVLWKQEDDLDFDPPQDRLGQDLGNDETFPLFVAKGKTGPFDASLEEVLHLVNYAGHSFAYPKVFGLTSGSELANAMDIARGGQFFNIPDPYPIDAWYSYDDETCEYDCQIVEYLYWAITSLLGAQENRLNVIGHEWKLNTQALLESKDPAIYSLLTNPNYQLPTKLPDGSYRH